MFLCNYKFEKIDAVRHSCRDTWLATLQAQATDVLRTAVIHSLSRRQTADAVKQPQTAYCLTIRVVYSLERSDPILPVCRKL